MEFDFFNCFNDNNSVVLNYFIIKEMKVGIIE